MCDKNLLLVASIEKFPCLYNFNLPEYMKKDVTEKAWNEVSSQVQLSVPECKEKWRNLRYSLLRSLKPNADGTFKKRYYLHKSMEFIIPFMKSFKNLFSTNFEEEIEEELSTQESNLEREVLSPHQQTFEYEFINAEPGSKRKRTDQYQHIRNAESISESTDTRKSFMLGLMPEINALSETQMKVFRRKVLALLDDITGDGDYEDEHLSSNFKTLPLKHESAAEDHDELRPVYTIK